MPRLLGLDLETTGLDIKADRIIKLGMILIDTGGKAPLFEKEWTLWHDDYPPISESAYQTHGIEEKDAREFGSSPVAFYPELSRFINRSGVDYIVAHNGNHFDFPMLDGNANAYDPSVRSLFDHIPKIDTATDIPYPPSIQTRKLSYLAAEHGFLNPFPHSTLSDIRTMFEILKRYPLEVVIERAKSETIQIHAKVVFETRQLAKDKRFYWDGPTQRWLKKIKACDFDAEVASAEFEIKIIKEG
jgi:DNA polymerase-3 subunit epsilon